MEKSHLKTLIIDSNLYYYQYFYSNFYFHVQFVMHPNSLELKYNYPMLSNLLLCYFHFYSDSSIYHSFHLYPVLINFEEIKISKISFFKKLLLKGISLQTHYIPVYKQSFMKKYKVNQKNFKNSEFFYSRQVSLPIHFGLNFKNIDFIINNIKKLLG